MSLSPGTRLDGYEILGPLGSGGMGEVYRARDSVLKREVAIKILPSFVSQDPDRLRRFQQEAEAAAALNHPNILAVHQLGTFECSPYLVSELLDGDTLRQLMQRGPLPVRKAIDYGVQIARGLAAAHEKGIVHRDLKPENLFVTKDGRVKILDFGLAKLTQRTPEPSESGPTLTHQGTEPGMVMGTVGYMAPEQVRGKTVDYRADIFAFGTILYEMLAGKRAFEKPTSADTMSAILNEDPPAISQIARSAPPGLLRVVQRCMEKNPEQRFQSASDLAFALEAISESGSAPIAAITQGSRSRRVWTALAGGSAVALVALFIAWWRIPPAVPVVESITQLTDDGEAKPGSLFSDGSRIYFNEGPPHGWKIAQVSVKGGPTALIETKLANPQIVGLAPDASALLAAVIEPNDSGSALWSIPLPAGQPRLLISEGVQSEDFLTDGRIVFAKGSELFVADNDGSNPTRLASVAGTIWNVAVSPHGQRIHLGVQPKGSSSTEEFDIAADGRDLRKFPKPSSDACCFSWNSDERYFLYFSKLGARFDIWTLPLHRGLFRRSGEPTRLTTGPLSFVSAIPSRGGNQIFAIATKDRGQLVRFDIKSSQFVPLLGGISATDATYSRDGKWVAYTTFPDHTLWRSHSDGSERLQLTYPPMEASQPFISPDGTSVAFGVNSDVYVIDINGGAPRKLVEKSAIPVWSPDGNLMIVTSNATGGQAGQKIVDLRTHKTVVVPSSDNQVGGLWLSQDTLLAANGNLTKLETFDLKTQKWTDLLAGNFVNWVTSPDHKYLYFATGGSEPTIQRMRVSNHKVETVTSLKDFSRVMNFGWTQLDVAPDGSPVLTRDISSPEIYALNVRWP